MFEDIIRTITIILLLLSGYLILKKIIELDERLTALEKSTLEIKKENYEEEYSTDHLFHMLKNNNQEIKDAINNLNRQYLHAYKIGFIHPLTKQYMEWSQPEPSELLHIYNLLSQNS